MIRTLLVGALKGGVVRRIAAKPYKATANPTRRPTTPTPQNSPTLDTQSPLLPSRDFAPSVPFHWLFSFSISIFFFFYLFLFLWNLFGENMIFRDESAWERKDDEFNRIEEPQKRIRSKAWRSCEATACQQFATIEFYIYSSDSIKWDQISRWQTRRNNKDIGCISG